MKTYCTQTLRRVLPVTNGEEIVLNGSFREWAPHVEKNLRDRSSADWRYTQGLDKKLLRICLDHSNAYEITNTCENTLMLVHPFYLHLSQMYRIRNQHMKDEAEGYVETLVGLLRRRDKSRVGVTVLETIHHYVAVTSLLLEQGLIDQVIFTTFDDGIPLDRKKLIDFRDHEIYFGGGYNGRCLTSAIRETKIISRNVWAIKDLVIDPPEECSFSLKPTKVIEVDSARVISFDQFTKRFL